MKSTMATRMALAAGAAALALAGCGTSPTTRFYTVEPVLATNVAASAGPAAVTTQTASLPSASAPTPRPAYDGPPLRIRAVHLPPTWDRIELIRNIGPHQVQVREFDQWAAPLGAMTRQTLTQNLAARLPPGAVLSPQAARGSDPTADISVDILALRASGSSAQMQATWAVRSSATAPWRRPEVQAALEVPLDGEGGDATALAFSRLLGQLADRIAADVSRPTPR